eukprot:CAMPEP_0185794152 /NCGR_PEP_ID=MMETSP1174-20130828/159864_1 /TAXON_ID=35687 /ORGANISM="Dictyocha speculum, Strain CCMP1381" /LENGTH=79 /DNA_ID=CAMNT_0028489363 /DNA_START=503 /DNA_END=743 /DNA_ORIENTATION=+
MAGDSFVNGISATAAVTRAPSSTGEEEEDASVDANGVDQWKGIVSCDKWPLSMPTKTMSLLDAIPDETSPATPNATREV